MLLRIFCAIPGTGLQKLRFAGKSERNEAQAPQRPCTKVLTRRLFGVNQPPKEAVGVEEAGTGFGLLRKVASAGHVPP
eukprot:3230815-Rhodomonas_salina.1